MAARPPWVETRADGVVLALHVQPGARRTAVVGDYGGRLKIAVTAVAAEGKANQALLEFIAARLGVPRTAVELLSGGSTRAKRVLVRTSLDVAAVADALATHQMKKAGARPAL
jgi:uncharacterized protein (TIGR00251 family)